MICVFIVPAFTICNADKHDAGLTLEELHAPGCLDKAVELVGVDSDQVVSIFDRFDTDGNQVVTEQELMAGFFVDNTA